MENQKHKSKLVSSIALLLLMSLLSLSPNKASALGMGIDAGLFLGLGTRGSENSSVEPEVWTVGGYLNGGFKLSPFIQIGGYFEYHNVSQRDEPAEVANLNLAGSGWLIGPSMALKFGPLSIIGAYTLMGSYEFDSSNAFGQRVELGSPTGIHLILGMEVLPMLSIDVGYALVEYSETEIADVAFDLSANKAQYESFRLGFSVHF